MLAIRIGQKRNNLAVGVGLLGPFGVTENGQGQRPSAMQVQVVDSAVGGASAHSVTVEGSMSKTGPRKVLATISDQNEIKVTDIPDYIWFNVGTATGGTVDVLCTGAVN